MAQLLEMGATPHKLTKDVVIKYRPNWCSEGLTTTVTVAGVVKNIIASGLKVEYAWMSTNGMGFKDTDDGPQVQNNTANTQLNNLPYTVPISVIPSTAIVNPASSFNGAVQWNGHQFFIEQFGAPNGVAVAFGYVKVLWEFKDPFVPSGTQLQVLSPNADTRPPP